MPELPQLIPLGPALPSEIGALLEASMGHLGRLFAAPGLPADAAGFVARVGSNVAASTHPREELRDLAARAGALSAYARLREPPPAGARHVLLFDGEGQLGIVLIRLASVATVGGAA